MQMLGGTRIFIVVGIALALCSGEALAKKKTFWAKARQPSDAPANSIGEYTAGCVEGALALPLNGPGYQVMRPSRKRFFGHPVLVAYIKDFAKRVKAKKIGPILVGDLAQPKGGPSPKGHASHQSGLDVDVWFYHPRAAERRKLRKHERETLVAHRVVDPKKHRITKYWSEEVVKLLRLAADDKRVARVLINPFIKKRMCDSGKESTETLRKLRPWYGHADHMHVRLHCPKRNKHCEDQEALPAGDGCEDLDWWLDRKAQRARRKGQKAYQKTVGATPELPEKCDEMAVKDRSERRSQRRKRRRRGR